MIDTTPLRKKNSSISPSTENLSRSTGNGRQSVLKISVIFAVGIPQG